MELLPKPTLNTDTNQALFKYLQEMSMNSQSLILVLKIPIEERITAHRKR